LFGAQQQVLCKDAGGRQGVATQYLPFPTKIQFTGTGFEYSDENGDFWRLTEAGVSGVSAEGTLDWGITNEGVTLEPQRGEEKLYEPLEVTICVNGQARQYKVLAAENN
jgi:hypothetical protein